MLKKTKEVLNLAEPESSETKIAKLENIKEKKAIHPDWGYIYLPDDENPDFGYLSFRNKYSLSKEIYERENLLEKGYILL